MVVRPRRVAQLQVKLCEERAAAQLLMVTFLMSHACVAKSPAPGDKTAHR